MLHHERINRLLAETLDESRSKPTAWQERLDAILTHRVWGSIAFAAAMAGTWLFVAFVLRMQAKDVMLVPLIGIIVEHFRTEDVKKRFDL